MTTKPSTSLELSDFVIEKGIHLHLMKQSKNYSGWRFIFSRTKLCGTEKCFRLKLKNFKEEPRNERKVGKTSK